MNPKPRSALKNLTVPVFNCCSSRENGATGVAAPPAPYRDRGETRRWRPTTRPPSPPLARVGWPFPLGRVGVLGLVGRMVCRHRRPDGSADFDDRSSSWTLRPPSLDAHQAAPPRPPHRPARTRGCAGRPWLVWP